MSVLRAPAPHGTLRGLPAHANLIRELVARDVRDRYSGSLLGMAWSLVTPILLIVIYSIVFGAVFGSRIPGMDEKLSGQFGFGVYLYSGLLIFNVFSEAVTKSPSLVWSNPNYVKKVVFPLEVLPLVAVFSSLVHAVVPFAVLIAASFLILGSVKLTAIFYPFVVLLMVPMLLGLVWALAALGAYVRDMGQLIGVLITVLMFMSPIFVPVEKYPSWAQPVVRANPITVPIELANAALFGSAVPPAAVLVAYAIASVAVFFAGWKIFETCRDGFADVI